MLGSRTKTVTFEWDGDLFARTGMGEEFFEADYRLRKIVANIGTNPGGQSVIVDVNRDGTTAFSSGKPTISTAGALTYTMPTNAIWRKDQRISFDIDQIGSTDSGADLTLTLYFHKV